MHEVIEEKSRGSVRLILIKCPKCSTIHEISLIEEKAIPIKTIISKGKKSERTTLYLKGDYPKELSVGDKLDLNGPLIVSAIEDKKGKRVSKANIKDIGVLWCKVKDSIKVTVNLGKYSKSFKVKTSPEEVFKIGEVYRISDLNFIVHAIRAKGSTKRHGKYLAEEIDRLYGKITPIKAKKVLDVIEN